MPAPEGRRVEPAAQAVRTYLCMQKISLPQATIDLSKSHLSLISLVFWTEMALAAACAGEISSREKAPQANATTAEAVTRAEVLMVHVP